jgi:malonyl-ACP O-methyltransferase BioC
MLNKTLIAHNFSVAAKNYDNQANIQKHAANQLIEDLKDFIKPNLKILDLGSGTSFIAKKLCENYHDLNLEIHEIDLAKEMLNLWKARPSNVRAILGDFENFNFEEKFDIITSSFSLQWLKNYDNFFAKIYKILNSKGIFIFCLPLAESLTELRKSSIESDCNFSFLELPKIDSLKNSLINNNLEVKSIKIKTEFEPCSNGFLALKKIKEIGANYSFNHKNFIGKNKIADFNNFYLKNSTKTTKTPSISWNIAYVTTYRNF